MMALPTRLFGWMISQILTTLTIGQQLLEMELNTVYLDGVIMRGSIIQVVYKILQLLTVVCE